MATTSDARRSLPLFDPNTEQPPPDAVELYLEAPRSLGVFYGAVVGNRESGKGAQYDSMAQAVERIQQKALDQAVQVIKREGGYAKVGYHAHVGNGQPSAGKYLPANLYVTAVSEKFADQRTDVARIHEHIYVGGKGLVDDTGQHWPIAAGSLKVVLSMAQAEYRHTIVKISESALELEWGQVPPLDSVEIMNPPMYQHVAKYPHVMCSGPFRIRQRWISRDVMSPEETRHAI